MTSTRNFRLDYVTSRAIRSADALTKMAANVPNRPQLDRFRSPTIGVVSHIGPVEAQGLRTPGTWCGHWRTRSIPRSVGRRTPEGYRNRYTTLSEVTVSSFSTSGSGSFSYRKVKVADSENRSLIWVDSAML